MKKRICIVTMTLAMVLLMSAPAWASVGLNINGRDYVPTSSPILEEGITSVSAQMLAETLGAELAIEGNTITITENQDVLKMTTGSTTALLNGAEKIMPKAPAASGDDILLPLRFVYECFGAKVDWDGVKQNIAVTYAETRDGLTPEQTLAQSSQTMQQLNTYKMSVEVDSDVKTNMQPVTGEAQAMSVKMTGNINGSVQYDPTLIYMTENMKMESSAAEEGVEEVNMEILLNKDGMYMTIPDQGWVKVNIPGMDIGKIMEQSMAQDPLDSMKQMADLGMSISFANDQERNGKKYWVLETTMGPDAVNQYLQESLAQIPEITEDAQKNLSDLYKNLNMDMTYQTWINQETTTTDYMVLNAQYKLGMDITEGDNPGHMDMDMDMNAEYTLYDFGAAFDVPDVSNAKDYTEVLNQSDK